MIHSPTCQHALRALIYLAEKDAPGPVLVREIADAAGVPRQSLAKILHGLRNKGLVRSTKGPGGGYQLARPSSELYVMDVIEAIDGRVELDRACILGLDVCTDHARCALHDVWKLFRENYVTTISSMTLHDAADALKRKRMVLPL
ncbi:MAG: Rrf2 family transcriptional regulator [Candidatus Krumholzibacteria bacterium]|nr:Rrf2 family transcriptional regulator [Candidatus Krumholzibacteria bacterium]MDH4335863.1 Rrf2 family transcriptional regulator [Candidatus Krumholzibacteria bacterium]MDH5270355.1 Rrf2 family transcriptional regulator [Candidatus Krumholzibacteria bacterium]MDH5628443.1 Rrf2 family transcriptional regulator [Candidatus Krumholzibacteria bacterium]